MKNIEIPEKRAEAVEACVTKITTDLAYAAPEMWPMTKEKIRGRIARMAEWLAEEVEEGGPE